MPSKSHEAEIWNEAPLLLGSSRHKPLAEIKNVMITGGAGFIASWVVRHLTFMYQGHYNVICFDKLDYCASINNVRQLQNQPNYAFYKGDITDPKAVLDCLQTHEIDTVMHFAAQSHVDLSFGNSYDFTSTNVYGTHVLLESVRSYGKVKKFIHVSTDEVYGEVSEDGADLLEDVLLAPTNPYAASKAAAEMLVNAYYKSFKIPVIVVRSNNVYGPHQFPEKVIPKFILLLQKDMKLSLHGNGTHTRRYLYASDAADAFDTILHRGVVGQIYNVGSKDEISNIDLCYKLLGLFEYPNETEEDLYSRVNHTRDRPFNDQRYAVDGSRLVALGWKQKTGFEEGLQTTFNWYKRFGRRWWGDIESRLTPFPEQPKTDAEDKSALEINGYPSPASESPAFVV